MEMITPGELVCGGCDGTDDVMVVIICQSCAAELNIPLEEEPAGEMLSVPNDISELDHE